MITFFWIVDDDVGENPTRKDIRKINIQGKEKCQSGKKKYQMNLIKKKRSKSKYQQTL